MRRRAVARGRDIGSAPPRPCPLVCRSRAICFDLRLCRNISGFRPSSPLAAFARRNVFRCMAHESGRRLADDIDLSRSICPRELWPRYATPVPDVKDGVAGRRRCRMNGRPCGRGPAGFHHPDDIPMSGAPRSCIPFPQPIWVAPQACRLDGWWVNSSQPA